MQRLWSHGQRQFPWAAVLLGICAALDVVEQIGVHLIPGSLGHLACSLRSLGVVASPLVPNDLLRVVSHSCASEALEPAISIIFLQLKLALALCLIAGIAMRALVQPQAVFRGARLEELERESYLIRLKECALGTGFMLALAIGFWLSCTYGSPQHFNTRLLHKLSYEEFFCLFVLFSGGFCIISFRELIALPLRRILS